MWVCRVLNNKTTGNTGRMQQTAIQIYFHKKIWNNGSHITQMHKLIAKEKSWLWPCSYINILPTSESMCISKWCLSIALCELRKFRLPANKLEKMRDIKWISKSCTSWSYKKSVLQLDSDTAVSHPITERNKPSTLLSHNQVHGTYHMTSHSQASHHIHY